ncbi:hypothetical protein WH47_11907 [Habropoda laboriosa]|uniref:Uncharacterized protein n=1 Tax=Habropoda laboriosa TaxID=597456 RepID=A0A0L7R7P5_9HYME|nr:hypothetical protein WH47_11907 [Habropoda laboriosa]
MRGKRAEEPMTNASLKDKGTTRAEFGAPIAGARSSKRAASERGYGVIDTAVEGSTTRKYNCNGESIEKGKREKNGKRRL